MTAGRALGLVISDVVISTVHVQTLLKMLISAYPTWCDRVSLRWPCCCRWALLAQRALALRWTILLPTGAGLLDGTRMGGKLDMSARCGIFLGLLLGCSELPDGTTLLRAFPALNCDEIENRELIGWFGTLLLCVGVPLVCTLLAALYLKRKFKSALSYFLVSSPAIMTPPLALGSKSFALLASSFWSSSSPAPRGSGTRLS
jgi:hypothetical protein